MKIQILILLLLVVALSFAQKKTAFERFSCKRLRVSFGCAHKSLVTIRHQIVAEEQTIRKDQALCKAGDQAACERVVVEQAVLDRLLFNEGRLQGQYEFLKTEYKNQCTGPKAVAAREAIAIEVAELEAALAQNKDQHVCETLRNLIICNHENAKVWEQYRNSLEQQLRKDQKACAAGDQNACAQVTIDESVIEVANVNIERFTNTYEVLKSRYQARCTGKK